MFTRTILAFSLLMFNAFSGEEICKVKNIKDYLSILMDKGNVKLAADEEKKSINSIVRIGEQRPNPEIDIDYIKGDEFGTDLNTINIKALHTIEYGNKRSNRIESAHAKSNLDNQKLKLGLLQYYSDQLISWRRVSQLNILIRSIKEAISTFRKHGNKLSRRSGVNPEEKISYSTIKLAENEYKARLNDLINERLLRLAEINLSINCEGISSLSYEDIAYQNINKPFEKFESGLFQIEKLKTKSLLAEYEIEKSMGYSNIKVGPQFGFQKNGEDEFVSAGIAVSFALPIFNTNDGGKFKAQQEINSQKISQHNKKLKIKMKIKYLYSKYRNSLKTMSDIPDLNEIDSKHAQIEKLFSRGLVPISLSIESHRQNIEFLKSRFETEMDLLEVLKEIGLIEGNLNKLKSVIK